MVIALLALLGVFVVLDIGQALRDSGWREHRWARRNARSLLEAYAEAEVQGQRILDVSNFTDTTTHDSMRRRALTVRWRHIALVLVFLAIGLALPAVWWIFVLLAWLALVMGSLSTERAKMMRDGVLLWNPGGTRARVVRIASVGLYLAAAVFWESAGFAANNGLSVEALIKLALGTGGAIAAAGCATSARRLRALGTPVQFGDDTARESVLFLRSFSDDDLHLRAPISPAGSLGMLLGGTARFEELIGSAVTNVAPMVAIGRPGERLPRLGAARTYVPDDAWQGAVERTARRASAIALIAGSSEGLGWELHHLRHRGLLSKSIVIVPPLPQHQALDRIDLLFQQLGMPSATPDTLRWLIPVLRTLVGIGFTEAGEPVMYVSDGRDWLSYVGVVLYFRQIVTGRTKPVPHGEIARLVRGVQVAKSEETS